VSGVLQGVVGSVVGTEFGVEITQDSDADLVAHAFDCTRQSPANRVPSEVEALAAWCIERKLGWLSMQA